MYLHMITNTLVASGQISASWLVNPYSVLVQCKLSTGYPHIACFATMHANLRIFFIFHKNAATHMSKMSAIFFERRLLILFRVLPRTTGPVRTEMQPWCAPPLWLSPRTSADRRGMHNTPRRCGNMRNNLLTTVLHLEWWPVNKKFVFLLIFHAF